MDIYKLIWCQNELLKVGCVPNFTDKSRFPYSFAKRRSECVPVLGYERVSVSGGELCRREGKTLQSGKIKMLSAVHFPEGLCSCGRELWLSYGLGEEWV